MSATESELQSSDDEAGTSLGLPVKTKRNVHTARFKLEVVDCAKKSLNHKAAKDF